MEAQPNKPTSAIDSEFGNIDHASGHLEEAIENLETILVPIKREPVPENPVQPALQDIAGTSVMVRRLGEIHTRIEQYASRINYLASELEI